MRYRCRVGHGFSEDALVVEQGGVDAAPWSALEALEERAELLRRLAARHPGRDRGCGRATTAQRDALDRADLIRRALGTRADRPDAQDLHGEEVVD